MDAIRNGQGEVALTTNKELFALERVGRDAALADRLAGLTDADYTRLPVFAEREAIQREKLNLPLLPTTTIGSFPQTKEIRSTRLAFRKGNISEEEYDAFVKAQTDEWIAWQEEVDFDVLVHGEFERNDMVEYFGENLSGYLFSKNGWVQSYGMRGVKPPIIWGDVTRLNPITVKWSSYAQSRTNKPVKGMLTGPVTILNWSFPREDISIKESTLQIALAIKEEVLDLEAAGIKIIQIDEAALRENYHSVVATGTASILIGQSLPSVWYTQLLHQIRKFTLTCAIANLQTSFLPSTTWMRMLSPLKLAVQILLF